MAKQALESELSPQELRELAASLLEPPAPIPVPAAGPEPVATPWPGADGPILSLAEVLGDANGEVVLANEAGLRALRLEADSPVVDQGVAPAHVTAAGDDVTGLAYLTFASGLTLYYPAELDLSLSPIG